MSANGPSPSADMNVCRTVLRKARSPVAALWITLTLPAGCRSNNPFSYVQVSGKITYDNGSLIPADSMVLAFIPQGGSLDAKTHPRPGRTTVNRATGEFHAVTSHTINDGLPRGKYKVVVWGGNYVAVAADDRGAGIRRSVQDAARSQHGQPAVRVEGAETACGQKTPLTRQLPAAQQAHVAGRCSRPSPPRSLWVTASSRTPPR